ncbi:TetR/AcrR family transcriptional regulator [Curtobacterium sp. ME26]|uniref:TetR/AcrR family transcriptional regulator n=1 Tax=Curtobacterium sp. ME26 TaxID=2744254 RepID=UPI0015F4C4D7|nr:TetR/AcrR family transcriptional regulator [Curtobacterium sp. ME26]
MSARDRYHHGDLRNALLVAAKELIRERGTRGFSVAEAARRAGVSISAPYRHFADRDEMLAAVATAAFTELNDTFAQLPPADSLSELAGQIAGEYVKFADADHARFQAMFASGIDKREHDALLDEATRVQAMLEEALAPHVPSPEITARAAELWTLAHGVASLSISGSLAHATPEHQHLVIRLARTWAAGVTISQSQPNTAAPSA